MDASRPLDRYDPIEAEFGADEGSDAASAPLSALPWAAQLYVACVVAAGVGVLFAFFPHAWPQPALFVVLTAFACLTSAWKINLPIPVSNGSTLSVSYAANLMSLLLIGPQQAVLIAIAGVITQCTYKAKQPYPLYRTVFSAAGAAVTMNATAIAYGSLGGTTAPFDGVSLARPLVAAIAAYFLVNTGLVAGAIALSTNRNVFSVWRKEFLWSGASFMVAGTAGALAAVVVDRGEVWKAVLLIAPIYLTYRTYELFVGRLQDQRRHMVEMRRMHRETVAALDQAREAEQALAGEKERLAQTLADMTRLEEARRHLLEREQAARAAAEHAVALKDEFLAIVSHELRTPLTAILGWTELMRRGKLGDAQRERAFRTVHESAKRQAQLIEDLLDVSRIMSGKLRLDATPLALERVVRDALNVMQPTAEAKGVHIVVEADPGLGTIMADGARVQQVVWNLLSNAVKFTPAGGLVHVRLSRRENGLDLVVSDTGEGIASEFLPWIFDPFRQADGSTTRVHRGLGLGLSIVKSIVEAHKGTVSAESKGHGHGATFTVWLPRISAGVARASQAAIPMEDTSDVSLKGLSVLVVDDDPAALEVVAAHLLEHEASILTAMSASEGFELLQHRHVDVILADISMPDEDGYAFIRRVRQGPEPVASVPAAALTAFARREDRQEALAAGFQLHLPKPIDGSSLIQAVAGLAHREAA